MKFNELDIDQKKTRKRVGRGISAGQGKTAGRGTKGQNSRSGGKVRPGFEGGQNPLMQRLPKLPGFTSHKKAKATIVTRALSKVKGSTVNNKTLAEAGLIDNEYESAKIVLNGEVSKKYTVSVQAISQGAKSAIEAAGGSVKIVERPKKPQSGGKKQSQK